MKRNRVDWMIVAAAGSAAAVIVHWAATHPALLGVRELRGPFFVELLLASRGNRLPLPEGFRQAHLAVIACLGLGAAALSLVIVLKSRLTPATRQLAAALALAPLSAAMFYFLGTHGLYRDALQLGAGDWRYAAFLFVAYSAGLAAPVLLVRFFIGYPRQPTLADVAAFRSRIHGERVASVRTGWRGSLYGPLTRALDRRRVSRGAGVGDPGGQTQPRTEVAQWRFHSSAWGLLTAILLAALASGIDALAATTDPALASAGPRIMQLGSLPWLLNSIFIVSALTTAYLALEYHHREAIADDRARIDWIYGTVLVAGILSLAIAPASWTIVAFVLPSLEPGEVSPDAFFFGPAAFAFEFFLAAVLASLALSIFYRGAVDPRLAMQRITLIGVMGLVVAVLFVIVERAVALKLAAWLGLPAETGAMLAAGIVAGTVAPMRKSAERGIRGLVSRFLPLDALVEGERKTVAVVLCDLSGYTALSARDEKQAMLAAALLQRLAARAAEDFEGRVVKSMGDAVILVFDSAAGAKDAMSALHEKFGPGATALGLPALPVHSGAHYGEVTQTHDGDIYGQTVNIAARLQSVAKDGQRVVSVEFARAAALAEGATRSLGARQLKNVPGPVECLELA